MNTIILYLAKLALRRIRKKKSLQSKKVDQYVTIFDSDDDYEDEYSPIQIEPCLQCKFELEDFLRKGVQLSITRQEYNITLVMGQHQSGKTSLIGELLFDIPGYARTSYDTVQCYTNGNDCCIEYNLDKNNEFLMQILLKMSQNVIILTGDRNYPKIDDAFIIHNIKSREHKLAILKQDMLLPSQRSEVYFGMKGTIHILRDNWKMNVKYLRSLLIVNVQNPKVAILKAMNSHLQECIQILPYKVGIVHDKNTYKLFPQLNDKQVPIICTYIMDHYKHKNKVIQIQIKQQSILVQSMCDYLTFQHITNVSMQCGQLIFKCILWDSRYQLTITLTYKRSIKLSSRNRISIGLVEDSYVILYLQ